MLSVVASRSSCDMNAERRYFGISSTSTSYSGKWPRDVYSTAVSFAMHSEMMP